MPLDVDLDELDVSEAAGDGIQCGQPDLGSTRPCRSDDPGRADITGVDLEVRRTRLIAEADLMAGHVTHKLCVERKDLKGALIGLEGMHVLEVIREEQTVISDVRTKI
jgi:hypothetical protein